jgi:PAS domain-containing protein
LSFFIDRKRSETALREHQQQLAAMAEHIPGCVYRGVVHPNGSMKLLYISEGEHELSGLDPHKLMGESERLLEEMSPQERGEFYQALKAVAQSQKPVTQEYPIASPSGEVKWVRNSARYTLSENGDVMVDGLAIDISDCLQRSFASPIAAAERMRILERAIATSSKGHPQ